MFREMHKAVEFYNRSQCREYKCLTGEEESGHDLDMEIDLLTLLHKHDDVFVDTGEGNLWELTTSKIIITVGVDFDNNTITGLSVVEKATNKPHLLSMTTRYIVTGLIMDIFRK